MKLKIIIFGLVLLMLKSCAGLERLNHNLETDVTLPDVDAVVQDEIIKQNIPGAAVAVVQNGRIVHINGYGHTSLDRTEDVTIDKVFRWASISKPLTAVAILQLDEQYDDFSIEDNVSDYVSYWPDSGQKGDITIKQLLSHRAGITHYRTTRNCPANDSPSHNTGAHGSGAFNVEDAVDIFKDEDLCFEPGSSFKYSTYGYTLAAAIFEEVSGESYADWVMDNIAQPTFMLSLQQATGTSEGYNISGGRLVDRSEDSKAPVLPGGGWESNIRDLALFGNAIMHNSLLDNTSRLWTESTGNSNAYRLGINRRSGGNRVEHGGAHDDLRTKMELYPGRSDSLGVFVYINSRHGDRNRLARRVAKEMGVSWNVSDDAIVEECTDSSGSHRYSAVWRKTGDDVLIRKGLSTDDFGSEWSYLREHQYYTDDFEAYTEGGELRWDGIFRKGTGGNAMWRNFSRDGFNEKWQEQSDLGYRLVDVETYMVNGERRWAGLFRPGSGPYALFRYYNTEDFADKREEMAEDGLKLIDIEAFTHNGNLRWAGVWIEGEDGLLYRNYTQNDFGDLRAQRRDAGYKLIDIERYNTGSGVRWAGIWEDSDADERLYRNYRYCGEQDDDGNWDPLGITNRHNQWRANGFELIDWERN